MSKPRLIAFYLPQFYPTPENDEWWEPGFTEWTNVARAKPLFPGHYQPKIPRDLGFYDLRVPETREKQAQLAREAGIEGFCYWHYWFGNGKRLLDQVFREVVETGKPDFPFCLCWANHSWAKKLWDPTKPDIMLLKQTYPGEQDYINHFNEMLPAFKDPRYIKVNGKLLFGVFSPLAVPDLETFKDTWNKLAKQNGLGGFCFFGRANGMEHASETIKYGYDCVCVDYVQNQILKAKNTKVKDFLWRLFTKITPLPIIITYNKYVKDILNTYIPRKNYFPCIAPNFDHSPRSTNKGVVLLNSSPQKWGNLCRRLFAIIKDVNHEENIVFLKAWNEWGEGNYLEPDRRYGNEYLNQIKEAYDNI